MDSDIEYEKFSDTMHAKFPLMFSKPYGGFAIRKGWYHIIETLCDNIQAHIDWKNNQFYRYERGETVPQVTVAQVKEKFGGLRFYYDGGDNEIHGMVRMAESMASHICETCGDKGYGRSGGWIRTLCDKHEAEYQEGKQNV